jgi:hypothetical protein
VVKIVATFTNQFLIAVPADNFFIDRWLSDLNVLMRRGGARFV